MMTMIGRKIATMMDALRRLFDRKPTERETPYGREWFPSGGRVELLCNGSERRIYNTHDIVELNTKGEVVLVITHDGWRWKKGEEQ